MTNQAQPRGTPSKRRGTSLTDFEQLLNLNSTKAPSTADIPDTAEAVIYLRVSTTRQMNTAIDIDEDGNSIATQREATIRRCRQLKAPISKEFVEPGNSAQSIAKRPQFKQLLHYVEEHPEVGYVVIYMRSRAFRNLTDAALIKRILANMGVRLVSAKEDFGEGYMADAMEAIADVFNELEVRRTGEDISTKMHHKAKNGGTTGRAKLGYLNVRKSHERRLIHGIDIDTERAPLIRWAFEQYATNAYSLARLQQELADLGLTTRPTARWAEKPVSRSQIARILRDPYYIGMVVYCGEVYPGKHEPLITPELFERVQQTLDTRIQHTHRDIVHNHFLRGRLLCGRCHQQGRRNQLIYSQATNSHGTTYEYYLCIGRQDHTCDLPHLQVADVEEAIMQEVASLKLTTDEATQLRTQVEASLHQHLTLQEQTRNQLIKELKKLNTQEDRLVDLLTDGTLPTNKLRKRLNNIRIKQTTIQQKLERTSASIQQQTDTVLTYIDLLEHPAEFYSVTTPDSKRKLLSAFYTNIWIDDENQNIQPESEQREIVTTIQNSLSKTAKAVHDQSKTTPQGVVCSNDSNLVHRLGLEPRTH